MTADCSLGLAESRMRRDAHVRFGGRARETYRPRGRWRVLVRPYVVLCPNKERAEAAKSLAAAILAPLGLRLHPDKTRIVCLRQGEAGFDFLGFHHRMVESRKWRGRFYLQKWPSDRAMASIRAKVREHTARRYASRKLEDVVADLNPVLRGWGAYFRYGNSTRKFTAVDSHVTQRMAKLASAKHGLRGWNWTTRFTYRWLNQLGIYRLSGTVRYWTANA